MGRIWALIRFSVGGQLVISHTLVSLHHLLEDKVNITVWTHWYCHLLSDDEKHQLLRHLQAASFNMLNSKNHSKMCDSD